MSQTLLSKLEDALDELNSLKRQYRNNQVVLDNETERRLSNVERRQIALEKAAAASLSTKAEEKDQIQFDRAVAESLVSAEKSTRKRKAESELGLGEVPLPQKRKIDSVIKTDKHGMKYIVQKVKGDGNCLFSSVAKQLMMCADEVRAESLDRVLGNWIYYSDFMGDNLTREQYAERMSVRSTYTYDNWGDSVSLNAISSAFDLTIKVFADGYTETYGTGNTRIGVQFRNGHYNIAHIL
jgi:hypothetical protein